MTPVKASRPILIAGALVCAVMVIALSIVAVLCWLDPDSRREGFPLVLLFVLVFGYRFYRYVKLIPPRKIAA
jgi:hypothetical protein